MPFPNAADKHGFEAIVKPENVVTYLWEHDRLPEPPPRAVVICYSRRLLSWVVANEPVRDLGWPSRGTVHLLQRTGGSVAVVADFGVGAPATTMVVEELIAYGATDFVIVGSAGTLQPDCPAGSVVVCERAIRDEGTSHHYLPPEKYALPSPDLTRHLAKATYAAGLPTRSGTSWTIDAPYRETVDEAQRYQREGVCTVEMEAAALFSVARVRGVRSAAAFFVTDSLAELAWRPEFHAPELQTTMPRLFTAAVDVLVDNPAD